MAATWVDMGGYYRSPNLSKELRTALKFQIKFRQFCDAKSAVGKNKGDTFNWNIYLDVATQGGTVAETNVAPETTYTVVQGTLTVDEMINSIPYTGKLDDLSMHPIKEIINGRLKVDAAKAFDIQAHAQFNLTPLRINAYGGTSTSAIAAVSTTGTATTTNSIAFSKEHVGAMIDMMKERNIGPYVKDDYYAIAWPSTFRTMKNSLESVHQYTSEGLKMIMNGEVGRYENCRFVEQTHIPKGGAADSTTWNASTHTADAWNNGLSDWIYFIGEDAAVEGIVVPEEMRGKIPTNYGLSKGIAWYYLGGFGLVRTTAAQSTVVKWDSAI